MPKKKPHKTFFVTARADILFECYAKDKKEAKQKFNSTVKAANLYHGLEIHDHISRIETANQHFKNDCWP